jgi:hypothetical protein
MGFPHHFTILCVEAKEVAFLAKGVYTAVVNRRGRARPRISPQFAIVGKCPDYFTTLGIEAIDGIPIPGITHCIERVARNRN